MLSSSRKNKQIFILSNDVTLRSAHARAHARAPRYGRRHFQFSYKKYHSDNFFVNSRLWGMLSSSRKKYIKFIRAKLCLWGPRAHARTRARTRYGRGTYLWISFKLLWILQKKITWKLVIFHFFSYILHISSIYGNMWVVDESST